MAKITEAQILLALEEIIIPTKSNDGDKNIVALGMISGIAIKDRMVQFSIEIDPSKAEEMEGIRKKAEQCVNNIDGILSATAILTAEAKAKKSDNKQQYDNKKQERNGKNSKKTNDSKINGAADIKYMVAIASGKGGVGKSTTSVNIALSLKSMGLKVGLLDADVFGPSMPRMTGINKKPQTTDGNSLEPVENYGIKIMSMGFMVAEDQPVVWRGPMVMGALQQMLNDVNWGELDILIIDMPPGTGDAQLTMSQNAPLNGAVIVSTPQDIALIDAKKGLNMFLKVNVPVLGIIENMSFFLCPECGHQSDIFGHGGARAEAKKLDCKFLGEIPLHMDIRTTSDSGNPIVISQPNNPHSLIYNDIANKIWNDLN